MAQLDLYFKKIILTADRRMTRGREKNKSVCKEIIKRLIDVRRAGEMFI